MITAGVLSQFKVPFCGGFQNLPALSDKGNYPYFFRVSFSNKWGSAIATLLNEWNVKRVAMIYDSDDIESVGAYLDIRNELYADGVTVLAIRSYHGASWPTDFTDILENLLYVDARYIIVCAQSWSPSYDLVSAAERFGLISPQHQWIVTNQPYPSNYSGIGQDARLDKMIGMIWPSLDGEKASSPDFQESERKWISAYNQNPVKYQIDYLNWVNEGAYDCLGTILYGLDGFLKMHGHPAEKLTSRGLNDRLNFTIFQNTGFKGTLLNPMRLDSNGDITANTSFATINAEMFETGTQPNFCTVEKETGKFIALSALPVFFGGSNVPPPDGPPVIEKIDVVNSLHNTRGIVIISAICFCYILCLLQIAFLLAYRNSTIVKALNVPHSLISISGCLIMVSGMIFYLEDLNSLKCRARVWFVAIGFVVMVLPLVGKNYYIFRIVTSFEAISTKQLMRFSLSVHGATIVGIIMEVILLGFWTATTKYSPKQYQDAESIFYLCHHHSFGYSWSTSLLWIFNSSVLLLAAYMAYTCRNVTPTYNESSLLAMVSVSLSLLISTVSFLERNETQGLKEALAIFITATALPIILVGPVILRTFIHSDPTLLVTGGQTGTAQSMSMRSSKLGQTDSYQANTTWRGPVSNKAKVQAWYKKQDVVFRHCSEAAIWSPWKESPGVILGSDE
ncbi:periplasmic binding protein-like I [Obelidium mucronatum]|nr:periplasmic binding protein-like I [Obelidium mucronatum]